MYLFIVFCIKLVNLIVVEFVVCLISSCLLIKFFSVEVLFLYFVNMCLMVFRVCVSVSVFVIVGVMLIFELFLRLNFINSWLRLVSFASVSSRRK